MPKQGYISGSRFGALMTRGRGKNEEFGKVAQKLITRILFERKGYILEESEYLSSAMQWGIDQEPYAISRFEQVSGLRVHSSQVWQQHGEHEFVGCTPDGLVGDDAVLEVKCPETDNHIDNVFFGSQVETYKWQLQGSMWVTGRSKCYFVSYDPRTKLDISIHEIQADPEAISQIEERYHKFEQEVERCAEILEARDGRV